PLATFLRRPVEPSSPLAGCWRTFLAASLAFSFCSFSMALLTWRGMSRSARPRARPRSFRRLRPSNSKLSSSPLAMRSRSGGQARDAGALGRDLDLRLRQLADLARDRLVLQQDAGGGVAGVGRRDRARGRLHGDGELLLAQEERPQHRIHLADAEALEHVEHDLVVAQTVRVLPAAAGEVGRVQVVVLHRDLDAVDVLREVNTIDFGGDFGEDELSHPSIPFVGTWEPPPSWPWVPNWRRHVRPPGSWEPPARSCPP